MRTLDCARDTHRIRRYVGNSTVRVACAKAIFFLFAVFLLPYASHSQNIVLNVTDKVFVNGQPVKKGDYLSNDLNINFESPNTELKILSPVGVCVIKYEDYEQKKNAELLDLIKFSIRKNSVATLNTRDWKINPSRDEQIKLVDALCKKLDVTPGNVNERFSQYITPYCALEFDTPYWSDIATFMQIKYKFNPSQFTGEIEMSPEQYESIPQVPQVRSLVPLPLAISLKKYAPIPGYQGEYGTCTGWASAYAARTISWAVKNNLTDVLDITNQAFSPSFVYAQIKKGNDNNCQKGATISASVEILKNEGVVFHTDLTYQCNPYITPYFQQAKAYIIKDYQRLTTGSIKSDEDLVNIKRALADKKPVLCSINCYDSFMNLWGKNIWNGVCDRQNALHAVCIIGYDDNYDNGDGTFGAVEMMNSWGTTWGEGGFIHVKYQDLSNIMNHAISLYDDVRLISHPESPKLLPVTLIPPDTLKRMEGSFDLILSDGTSMRPEGDKTAFRNLRLVSDEKMTYNILNSYPAGTMFRIQFISSQPAYVYVISTDSKRNPLVQLFPDPVQNISALLDFHSEVAVSIPGETQYIQMDETSGEDYLCVIYSKEELNIEPIRCLLRNNPDESFVKIVKEALADKIVDSHEVMFEENSIAFKAASKKHSVVPVFVKINHR